MKKILIMYAPFGRGHQAIAQAIATIFNEKDNYEVKILDIAKNANNFGKLVIKVFDKFMCHRTNYIWSFLYKMVDNKLASLNQLAIVKKCFDNEKMRQEISNFNPDLTISTHFYAGNIIAYYNKLALINSKIMTVITDYTAHNSWRKGHKYRDAYIVANKIVKNDLLKYGIASNKIYDFGLPFNIEKKANIVAKEEILNRYYLTKKYKTFLFFGGGVLGNMGNYEYLKLLIKSSLPINIIFISGKNKKLEDKCRSYVVKHNIKNVKILGFTNEVYSLLNASDVVITKAGGATITECIDMQKPMIIIPGNGGPERDNSKFIVKAKYGLKVNTGQGLSKAIKKILANEKILTNMQKNLQKRKTNNSQQKIFELSEKLLKM